MALDGLHSPGHTDGHFAYRIGERLFSSLVGVFANREPRVAIAGAPATL